MTQESHDRGLMNTGRGLGAPYATQAHGHSTSEATQAHGHEPEIRCGVIPRVHVRAHDARVRACSAGDRAHNHDAWGFLLSVFIFVVWPLFNLRICKDLLYHGWRLLWSFLIFLWPLRVINNSFQFFQLNPVGPSFFIQMVFGFDENLQERYSHPIVSFGMCFMKFWPPNFDWKWILNCVSNEGLIWSILPRNWSDLPRIPPDQLSNAWKRIV